MPPLCERSFVSQSLAFCALCEFQRRLDRGDGQHCIGRMVNNRIIKRLRCLAVRASCVVQALAGIILSLLALIIYQLIPTLRQPPPALIQAPPLRNSQEAQRRLSILTHQPSDVSSDGSLESPNGRELHLAIPPPPPPHDRNRPARRRTRAPSSTLPTLTESSQSRSPSARDPQTTVSSPTDAPDAPSSARSSPPLSPHESEAEADAAVGPRRKASFRLSYFLPHKHGMLTRTLVSPLAAVTSLPHHGRKPADAQRRATWPDSEPSGSAPPPPPAQRTWDDRAPGASSKWKLVPLHAPKKPRERRPAARTQPYEAPYFFPSPASPDAEGYVSKARASTRRTRVSESQSVAARTPSPQSSVVSEPLGEGAGRAVFGEPVRARSLDDASVEAAMGEEQARGPRQRHTR